MHNFGKLKHHIYEIAAEGIANKDNDKKAILKKFISTIKESKILRTQASVYHNIENRVDESDFSAHEYVKENLSLLQRFKIADIVKENKKLTMLLEGYEIKDSYDKSELHENIHHLITTKKTTKTLNQLVESANIVKNYILTNTPKETIKEDVLPNSMVNKFLSEKFNEKYSELSENEIQLIKSVITSNENEQSELYEQNRTETIKMVNESIKECDDVELKSKLLDVKERLLESKFNKDSFITDIVKIINLQKNLND